MSFTLCSSGAIVIKAGKNVNSTAATSGALLSQFSDEAEGRINAATLFDWVLNYNTVKANYKPILAEASANFAAMNLIAYDMSGYTSRGEAESLINVLFNSANKDIDILKDNETKIKMGVV